MCLPASVFPLKMESSYACRMEFPTANVQPDLSIFSSPVIRGGYANGQASDTALANKLFLRESLLRSRWEEFLEAIFFIKK